jgi:hypothetical protein
VAPGSGVPQGRKVFILTLAFDGGWREVRKISSGSSSQLPFLLFFLDLEYPSKVCYVSPVCGAIGRGVGPLR